MKSFLFITALASGIVTGCLSCSDKDRGDDTTGADTTIVAALLDANATEKTKALYRNLFTITDQGTMFGRQIPTLYGLDKTARGTADRWNAVEGDAADTDNSDTRYLTGSHPAVCGWDITNIELDAPRNIDNELFGDIRNHIIAAFRRGAVCTMSWHAHNPATYNNPDNTGDQGSAWDHTEAVRRIIPGGDLHDVFKIWLDKVAAFIATLKDGTESVPIILRPYHEHSGGSGGFWWGNCTAEDFVELWQFTIGYLTGDKALHNLIIAYSPDMIHIKSRDDYLDFWPGDEWVDILGLDAYDRYESDYAHRTTQLLRLMKVIAGEKHKPFALTETGLENNDPKYSDYCNERWWTKMLYPAIKDLPVAFALVWRNGYLPPKGHFFGAFRGCYTEQDFIDFASRPRVLLENDLPDMYR